MTDEVVAIVRSTCETVLTNDYLSRHPASSAAVAELCQLVIGYGSLFGLCCSSSREFDTMNQFAMHTSLKC